MIKGRKVNYNPKECADEARALCEKMNGKKCSAVLSVMAYEDESEENGCKLLFSGEIDDESPGAEKMVEKMSKIYGVATLNIRSSVENMARAIAKQGGPEAEASFRKKLADFISANEKTCRDQIVATTVKHLDNGKQEELS